MVQQGNLQCFYGEWLIKAEEGAVTMYYPLLPKSNDEITAWKKMENKDVWFTVKSEAPVNNPTAVVKFAILIGEEIEGDTPEEKAAHEYASVSYTGRQDLYDGFLAGVKWYKEYLHEQERITEFDGSTSHASGSVSHEDNA